MSHEGNKAVLGFTNSIRTQPPLHALILFGKSGRIEVQVRLHGDEVRFVINRDGQLERDTKFADAELVQDFELCDPDGTTTYLITSLEFSKEDASSSTQLYAKVEIKGSVGYRQYCDVAMRPLSEPPELAHFHGPLSIGPIIFNWQVSPRLALRTGDTPTDLNAIIGTFDTAKKCWTVVCVHDHVGCWLLPERAFPVVDVEFPLKQLSDPPIHRRYSLEGFC